MMKPRRGRPSTAYRQALRYFAWLREHADADSVVAKTQRTCAQLFKCSERSIKNYERLLRASGMIDRQRGHVILLHPASDAHDVLSPDHRSAKIRLRRARACAEKYLAWLLRYADCDGILHKSRRACAYALSYSLSSIKRFEKLLRDADIIERRYGFVIIKRRTLNEEETP